jgi:cytochrome b
MVKPQCFMVQASRVGQWVPSSSEAMTICPQVTAHLEKNWKTRWSPKFPDHQPLGELMSMALQANPQWNAENGVCEATSSGTSPSPTTKHFADLRVHPHLRGYKRRKLLQAPVPMLIGVVHIPIKGTKKTRKVKALVDSHLNYVFWPTVLRFGVICPDLGLFAPTSVQQVVHRCTALLACRAYAFCLRQMFQWIFVL